MRVAELTTYTSRLNGGVFFVLTALLPKIQADGVGEIEVFGYEDPRTREDRALWQGIPVNAFSPWSPKVFGYSPRFRPALAKFAPDVIHSHGLWTYLSHAALRVHRQQNVPMVISPHGMLDSWALALSARKKQLVGRLFQNAQLREAAVLHALNRAEVRAIRDYGLSNPVVVIPNGVDVAPPRILAAPPWSNHLIASRPKILLFMARLHPKKGLKELVTAWRTVQKQAGPARDWGLAISGWDEAGIEGELREFVDNEGLGNSVCFCGPLLGERKAAALSHAHAFVLPSFSEGLPMTVLEAWSYGLPAIISSACNLPEGVANGAALGCSSEPDSVAAAIQQLARKSESERQQMGTAAAELVRARFDWNSIAASFVRVYQAVSQGEPLPRDLLAD